MTLDEAIKILKREIKKYKVPIVGVVMERTGDPFKVLISTMLSLRTKDTTTAEASERLFKLAGTPEEMLKLSDKAVEKAIYPVGFYHTKARSIRKTCEMLVSSYGSRVPDSLEELLKLEGVGRKTANLVLTIGFDKYGICVDTHVHRITNRWGYVKTKNPEETEFALRAKLPRKYWKIINDLLVTYGQNLCAPVSPKCSECRISGFCKRVGVGKHR